MIGNLFRMLDIPMTPPPAYGTLHILMIVFGMTLCISLAWLCRKFDDRKNKILLLTFSGVLIASEIFKQLFLYFVLCNNSICWGEFPFQMCSLPMYLCPIAVLSKNKRVQKMCYGYMMCFNLLGGLAGVFEPSGVFHDQVALTVHAVAWHYSLVFLSFYLNFSHRSGTTMAEYKDIVKLFVATCFIAFIINTLIGITVGAEVNMFFVGPNPAPIIVFNTISAKYGWAASTAIYNPICCIAAGLIFSLGKIRSKKPAKVA